MKKINNNFLFPLIALISLVIALSQQMFNVPPMGKVLDPFIGAVQNESEQSFGRWQPRELKDSVHVYLDERQVPHIYARNEEDLFFTQGYITACYRLWQMDFTSYASAGRLSEIFADGFLDYDRNQRRTGILESAKQSLQFARQQPATRTALEAYTRGVNSYIQQLDYRTMPLEYKLLDYSPEPWSDLKTVLIMKYMAATLSGYEDDYNVSALMLALGESKFNKLFPDFLLPLSPVTPDSSGPVNEALVHSPKPAYLDYSFLTAGSFVPESSFNPHLGSNSWAVSGSKTKSGKPILCNDPHLNLTLPAIWIEMQLSCPGINVYGVSIPGTPSVIIGFNENIAWGLTNGANDVKDYYKLRLKGNYEQYELDGRWHNLPFRIDTIRKRGVTPLYDTIYYTVHGPVVFDKSFPGRTGVLKDMAMKWELHRPSNEFFTFIQLSKAQNYNEYREAISHYGCPVQNFTFACKDNTIAVDHQGNLPIKPAGAGRFILDGTQSSYLYNRYIPQDSLPHVVNPAGQFVFSANQHPTSQHYPYYYNGYFSEERANRIRSLLESNDSFDLAAMKRMQLDNTSAFAMDVLQVLIPIIQPINLTADQQGLLPALAAWKGNYDADNEQAKLFELWWQYIKEYTWDEFRLFSFGSKIPADYVLIDLIRSEPGNEYFDQLGTGAKETARDIVYAAFTRACAELSKLKKKGSIRWGDLNKVSITHLTRQSAFSITDLVSAGHPQAINAVSASWGPGWRMIVELGDRPRAIGIYAGGQSGNIGSRHYDEFITDWNKGNYYQLQFFMSEQEAKAGARKLTAIK